VFVENWLRTLQGGDIRSCVPDAEPDVLGLGLIEAWRGPVLIALESGPSGAIRRCHPHDPSWQNWPLLEYAVMGNLVPDFPLINKSFNLSYSGQDT
jgi:Ni,Fe-hydrogenase III large subunit